ncbi:MAG: MotA/TolQ/ExbB proton channel family protein [Spirochaetota bacterium]
MNLSREQLVHQGELTIFYIMGIASVLALAVFIERWIVYARNGGKANKLIPELKEKIRDRDFEGIRKMASDFPKSLYVRFAVFSSDYLNRGPSGLGELMDGKITGERIELEKRLPILATLGNNAPFIGLLGTVLGVIKAFANLGTLGNSGAEVVMKNISTALFATAVGLLIAIPVVMINNYFTKKLKVFGQNLDILAKEFLATAHDPGSPTK